MNGGGTDNSAEMPKRPRRDGFGLAGEPVTACQAVPAPSGSAGNEAPTLLEEVLRRENLRRAYQRVRFNGGAAGVDGMTVQKLPTYIQKEWPRIREQLLSGTYQPQPVRKVEIPKPGNRVLASLERFVGERLRLTTNRSKSAVPPLKARPRNLFDWRNGAAVDLPWKRSLLGYTVTWHRPPKLKPAPLRLPFVGGLLRRSFGALAGTLKKPRRRGGAFSGERDRLTRDEPR